MSYILEALKQSELERLQGAAATRYSLQPALGIEPAPPRKWHYPVLAAALLINAVLLYPRHIPVATGVAAALPGPAPATPEPKTAAVAPVPARTAPAPPRSRRMHAVVVPQVARTAIERPRRSPDTSPPARVDNPAPAAPQPRSVGGERTDLPSELPSDLPRQLPAVAVAGYIRDGNANMVIVNDKLLREGDEVEPGLTLESIHGDSVTFNYKGYRFRR